MLDKPRFEDYERIDSEQGSVVCEIKRPERALKDQYHGLHNEIKKSNKIQETGIRVPNQPVGKHDGIPSGPESRGAGKTWGAFNKIVGQSAAMQKVFGLIRKAADSDANVAVFGESGTGKELAARAIHELSDRKNKEFVTVNCGAIPEMLLESEFFGYSKGAFTGAYADKHGYLDLADGGTLFLDEVGELTLNMQAKLLRCLDDGGYVPVGRRKPIRSDFRIIAATNKDLAECVRKGLMREDFFFRIHVIPITLPPLRERKEDIPLLLEHFLKRGKGNGETAKLPEEIVRMIRDYHWPGNVRELQNALHRYLAVESLDLLQISERSGKSGAESTVEAGRESLQEALETFEKKTILRSLQSHQWNRKKTASELGITRNTLFRKIRKFNLDRFA